MSLLLPPADNALRSLFDVADLVAVTTGERPLPVLSTALRNARATHAGNPAIRRVYSFALDSSNDQVLLISVGRRGGWRREWKFGPVPRSARLS